MLSLWPKDGVLCMDQVIQGHEDSFPPHSDRAYLEHFQLCCLKHTKNEWGGRIYVLLFDEFVKLRH